MTIYQLGERYDSDPRRTKITDALHAWVNQRPGLDPRNYGADWSAYRAEARSITSALRDARAMLAKAWELTADEILAAQRAYAGRLEIVERDGGVAIDYTTGQYWPTEYRAAACAVLAQAFWDHWRDSCKTGDEIRRKARAYFGRRIASRWFR